jgi:rhamnose transport system ATP-binding protein
MSVTENIYLGHEKINPITKTINWRQMHKDAESLLRQLGSDIDPHVNMGNLSVAEHQVVEIAKAISTNSKIIIMDEPTAALSNRECEQLYKITKKLRDDGASIIFISHRFEDMYRLATRVTVFSSNPVFFSPANASPLNFNNTRFILSPLTNLALFYKT